MPPFLFEPPFQQDRFGTLTKYLTNTSPFRVVHLSIPGPLVPNRNTCLSPFPARASSTSSNFSTNHTPAPTDFLQSHSRAYFPKGSACFIYRTSLWPCLRHGSLACSLPLPSAQASACRGRCPRTPFYHINTAYYTFIFMQSYHFFNT